MTETRSLPPLRAPKVSYRGTHVAAQADRSLPVPESPPPPLPPSSRPVLGSARARSPLAVRLRASASLASLTWRAQSSVRAPGAVLPHDAQLQVRELALPANTFAHSLVETPYGVLARGRRSACVQLLQLDGARFQPTGGASGWGTSPRESFYENMGRWMTPSGATFLVNDEHVCFARVDAKRAIESTSDWRRLPQDRAFIRSWWMLDDKRILVQSDHGEAQSDVAPRVFCLRLNADDSIHVSQEQHLRVLLELSPGRFLCQHPEHSTLSMVRVTPDGELETRLLVEPEVGFFRRAAQLPQGDVIVENLRRMPDDPADVRTVELVRYRAEPDGSWWVVGRAQAGHSQRYIGGRAGGIAAWSNDVVLYSSGSGVCAVAVPPGKGEMIGPAHPPLAQPGYDGGPFITRNGGVLAYGNDGIVHAFRFDEQQGLQPLDRFGTSREYCAWTSLAPLRGDVALCSDDGQRVHLIDFA